MPLNNELAVEHRLLELVWNHTNDAIFTIGYDGQILKSNPAFSAILGWEEKDFNQENLFPLFTEHAYKEAQENLAKLRLGENITYHVTERKRKDGQVLSIVASYRAVHSENILAVGMYKDFTEQIKIQQKLQASEACYRSLIEFMPDALFVEQNGQILFMNEPGMKMLGGKHCDHFTKKNLWAVLKSTDDQSLQEKVEKAKENKTPIIEKVERCDGQLFWAEIFVMSAIFNEQPVHQLLIRDVTLTKNYQEQLEYMAYHDPLTGLVNRRYFLEYAERMIKTATQNHDQFAILYIDMDKFKHINDTFGHDVGDELLKQFAVKLRQSVRKNDVICRIGGDEFLVLLKDLNSHEELENIIHRMIYQFKEPYHIKQHVFSITASMGASIFPQDGDNVKVLVRNADQALYNAKEQRNSYVLFDRLSSFFIHVFAFCQRFVKASLG